MYGATPNLKANSSGHVITPQYYNPTQPHGIPYNVTRPSLPPPPGYAPISVGTFPLQYPISSVLLDNCSSPGVVGSTNVQASVASKSSLPFVRHHNSPYPGPITPTCRATPSHEPVEFFILESSPESSPDEVNTVISPPIHVTNGN